MRRLLSIAAALVLSGPCVASANGQRSALLRVLYVGDKDSPRTRSYARFLDEAFLLVGTVDRTTFDPRDVANVDVVVLDWPDERVARDAASGAAGWDREVRSPLGDRAAWHKPTVLLGTAGRVVATSWRVFGASGCTCFNPTAYDLRNHPFFDRPEPIERGKLTRRPWPEEWTEWHGEEQVAVLPLIRPGKKPAQPGWCTYPRDMAEAPEIEVFSGGVNTRTSTAVAVWRQGNLLHFGFDAQPDEMTTAGKALLINSIAYISRFTDDQPILETPSSFAARPVLLRSTIVRIIARNSSEEWDYLKANFDPAVLASEGIKKLPAFAGWYPSVREFLMIDAQGLLTVDADALALYVKPARTDFFPSLIAKLPRPEPEPPRTRPGPGNARTRPIADAPRDRTASAPAPAPAPLVRTRRAVDPEDEARARRLLARYAPDGPGAGATTKQWSAWWKANGDYLFFAEIGGYRWFVDPLAQKRKIATAKLRGEKRASH